MSRFVKAPLRGLLAVAVFGCGEYPHTNPYEPSADVSITIDGPDIVTRTGIVTYTYRSDPVLDDVHPVWSTQGQAALDALGTSTDGIGVFRVISNGKVTIAVALGPHVQTKEVVVAVP